MNFKIVKRKYSVLWLRRLTGSTIDKTSKISLELI